MHKVVFKKVAVFVHMCLLWTELNLLDDKIRRTRAFVVFLPKWFLSDLYSAVRRIYITEISKWHHMTLLNYILLQEHKQNEKRISVTVPVREGRYLFQL